MNNIEILDILILLSAVFGIYNLIFAVIQTTKNFISVLIYQVTPLLSGLTSLILLVVWFLTTK